jgi:hypothetical protein
MARFVASAAAVATEAFGDVVEQEKSECDSHSDHLQAFELTEMVSDFLGN